MDIIVETKQVLTKESLSVLRNRLDKGVSLYGEYGQPPIDHTLIKYRSINARRIAFIIIDFLPIDDYHILLKCMPTGPFAEKLTSESELIIRSMSKMENSRMITHFIITFDVSQEIP